MLATVFGCITAPSTNPDYPATDQAVEAEYRRLREHPAPPPRPIVVLNGYRAPFWQASGVRSRLIELTGAAADRVIYVSYFWSSDTADATRRAVEAVQAAWPSGRADQTVEGDVVGISMGGLIGRNAAIAEPGRARLNVRRLFTLASPHLGPLLAENIAPDAAARDLAPGSAFLSRLDGALAAADYELVCYALLRDAWVGATRTAPPGRQPIWCAGPVIASHQSIGSNRRVLVDLARRLRGETPWCREGSPPPSD